MMLLDFLIVTFHSYSEKIYRTTNKILCQKRRYFSKTKGKYEKDF